MTPQEAAAQLDGRQYRNEVTREFAKALKAAGLVAVYGASDDLMEFDGAISDEIGCYGGGTAYLTSAGLLQNECDNNDCPHFRKLRDKAPWIEAIWGEAEFSWRYETAIPHAKFIIKEDDEDYCQGIVFALSMLDHQSDSEASEAASDSGLSHV